MKEKNEEDELLERIAREMMKSGDVKNAFDVEEKLRKSFGKIIKSMLEAEMDEHLGNNKYKHPTIKPLELVKRHILHTTQKDDIILDCFSGSGTTCVAAKELERQFIGIEINSEYYKISLDRLNGILANGQLSFDTDINKI